MEAIKFIVGNVMAPVFDNDLDLIKRSPLHDADDNHSQVSGQVAQEVKRRLATRGDSILDLSGPKLLDGAGSWLIFYRLLGQINLANKPLYLSVVYKLVLVALGYYILITHIALPGLEQEFANFTYNRNPIFVLMTVMTVLISAALFVTNSYQNLFNLSPLFKILTTPKLCFINRATQDISGADSTRWVLYFLLYHSLLFQLQTYKNGADFVTNFRCPRFIMFVYAINICLYYTLGLSHLDYYIRFCFGAWLLALRCNLQNRRPRLAYLRHQIAMQQQQSASCRSMASSCATAKQQLRQVDDVELMRKFKCQYPFVDLKEVQKQLNSMDDHLEVWRSCQTGSLVCVSLSAFFTNGIILMVAYTKLTKEMDVFRGLVWGLIAFNYAIFISICYIGDSFIRYALGCFVQTVEDEYILQQDRSAPTKLLDGREVRPSFAASQIYQDQAEEEEDEDELKAGILRPSKIKNIELERQHEQQNFCRITDDPLEEKKPPSATECLLIKKEDVSFCRELLHQFENHLATPWSRLTFKSHLNMMAAFATLIAAQIIFDREIVDD